MTNFRMSLELALCCTPWKFYCGIVKNIASPCSLVKADRSSAVIQTEDEGFGYLGVGQSHPDSLTGIVRLRGCWQPSPGPFQHGGGGGRALSVSNVFP